MNDYNLTPEQYFDLMSAGLKQIAHDATKLQSGNIAHRAAQIRANALQMLDITNSINPLANGVQQEKQADANAGRG
jgi:hypothetical protein